MARMSRWSGYSLSITQEMIDVTPGVSTIDPTWGGVDEHGHEHRGSAMNATCVAIREPCYCSVIDEPHELFVRWECLQCSATIEPGTLPPFCPQSIPGLRHMVVDHADGTRWEITGNQDQVLSWFAIDEPMTHEMFDDVGIRR